MARAGGAGGGAVGGGTGADAGFGVMLAEGGSMFAARRASSKELPVGAAGTAEVGRGDCRLGGGGIDDSAACTTGVLGFCPFAVEANN